LGLSLAQCTGFGVLTFCRPSAGVCYAVSATDFKAGCESIKGGLFNNSAIGELPACVVPGEGSQIVPCQGDSCTISQANFSVGCKKMGGFVSGNEGAASGLPVCSSRGPVSQFKPCPPQTSCTIQPGFADWCDASGGFIDGSWNSIPECAVPHPVSWFKPCNGSTTGCQYSGTEFSKACTGLGGMITAQIDGVPLCQVVGRVGIIGPCPYNRSGSCSYSGTEFLASCTAMGGFVMNNGGQYLPQCAFKDRFA